MTVIANEDTIRFSGRLSKDLKGALVCLFQIVSKSHQTLVTLDFFGATQADANVMLPICSYCAYYRANHIEFRLILPEDPRLSRLFVGTNWAHFIDPGTYQVRHSTRSNNLPALQFLDGDAQFNVVDKAINTILETVSLEDRSQLSALEWSIAEVTDNVLNHSESQIGGILQVQCFPARKRISFFVVDSGLGIATTLRRSDQAITSDTQALDHAIREGVTRNKSTNQGNGLFGTFKCCDVSDGSFFIRSNHAVLGYVDRRFSISNDPVPFRGSFVSATINYSTPRLLERALVFKGKVHHPNDYIELHFSRIGEAIVFELAKESDGFGSREFGKRTRLKIDNLLIDNDIKIIFDLSDVPVLSSSFADEVFGKLFASLGPMEFLRRCEFKNVDSTVRRLIDRAIEQRMKSGL